MYAGKIVYIIASLVEYTAYMTTKQRRQRNYELLLAEHYPLLHKQIIDKKANK